MDAGAAASPGVSRSVAGGAPAATSRISRHAAQDSADATLARYRAELDRLSRLPGVAWAVAALLAARNAGCWARAGGVAQPERPVDSGDGPHAAGDAGIADLHTVCAAVAGRMPVADVLRRCAGMLGALPRHVAPGTTAAPDPEWTAAWVLPLAEAWALASSIEALLAEGGDERLQRDPATGLNRYGCAPHPRPGAVAFSSCTGSSTSAEGLAAAESRRRAMLAAALQGGGMAAVLAESARVQAAILGYYGAAGLARAALVPSGTDATLLATAVIAAMAAATPGRVCLTSVLVDAAETGSGVPAAARGRHFAARTAGGKLVERDAPLAGMPPAIGLHMLAVRDECGLARPAAAIEAECAGLLERACAAGHVALHVAACSKTGLQAPGDAACAAWSLRFGRRLTVVLDASQARLDAPAVRAALARGWMVILTGSKFFGAPGFCGALLLPAGMDGADLALASGLDAYAPGLAAEPCGGAWHPGLLLRWAAALDAMAAYRAIPPAVAARRAGRLRDEIARCVAADKRLALLPAAGRSGWGLDAPGRDGAGQDGVEPSILALMVRSPDIAAGPGGRWMTVDELVPLYRWLNRDVSGALAWREAERATAGRLCHVGQPVRLGRGGVGALRLALSAAQLSRDGAEQEVAGVFAKLALLLDRHAALCAALG